ncbi:hypothetical protein M422DRAFT_150146, partial [Sphaerobolus stellatus SS14]
PKLTSIVVRKKHHMRFFPGNPREAIKENCPPGTVVDTGVVSPMGIDFYLQSHAAIFASVKGVKSSRHVRMSRRLLGYENRFTVKQLEAVSFLLCHVYARARRSVSIPAPVYCYYFIHAIVMIVINLYFQMPTQESLLVVDAVRFIRFNRS